MIPDQGPQLPEAQGPLLPSEAPPPPDTDVWDWDDVSSGLFTLGSVLTAPVHAGVNLFEDTLQVPVRVAEAVASVPNTLIEELGETVRDGTQALSDAATDAAYVAGDTAQAWGETASRHAAISVVLLPVGVAAATLVVAGSAYAWWRFQRGKVDLALQVAKAVS